MSTNEPHAPVACTPQALSAEAWATHQTTSAQLFGARHAAAEELPDGYAFRFPAAAFPLVAAFVAGERRCCPFFTFHIEVPPAEGPITLRITGSPEAKVVIAAELLNDPQRA